MTMGEFHSIDIGEDGALRCYVCTPKHENSPGILLLQEIAGVNFHLRAVADYLAELGYVVYAPNVFWRNDPVAENDYTPDGQQKALQQLEQFDDDQGIADLKSVLEAMRASPYCSGKVAAMGYCLGGRLAYLCGAYLNVDAAVCFYPTWIEQHLEVATQISCPVCFHLTEFDPTRPAGQEAEMLQRIVNAFQVRSNFECHVYPGAHHAFDSDQPRPVYNRWAAQLANCRSAVFLDRALRDASARAGGGAP